MKIFEMMGERGKVKRRHETCQLKTLTEVEKKKVTVEGEEDPNLEIYFEFMF